MIACVDVDYRREEAVAACAGIRHWSHASPCMERVVRSHEAAAPYMPGQFYLREMPMILRVLDPVTEVALIVVDGYVWLAKDRPGLGAHVYEHLGGRIPVVGVAKNAFHNNDCAVPIVRGDSNRPLYVTAVGIDLDLAVESVARMAGPHRVPTILRRVDHLARGLGSVAK